MRDQSTIVSRHSAERVLGGLLVAAGVLIVATRAVLPKDQPSAGLWVALVCLAGGPVLWLRAGRTPRWALHVALAGAAALAAYTVAVGGGGIVSGATAGFIVWDAIVAFHFLPVRPAVAHLAFAALAWAIALHHADPETAASVWVISVGNGAAVAGSVGFLAGALRRAARTDSLTGLLNRQTWDEAAAADVARAQRIGRPLSFVMVDMDGFKQLNDTYGHAAGDAALRAVADAFRAGLRTNDAAARFGGDEFAVLLPDTTDEVAAAVIGRIAAAVPHAFCSGTATWQSGESADATLARADAALYAAKAARGVGRDD